MNGDSNPSFEAFRDDSNRENFIDAVSEEQLRDLPEDNALTSLEAAIFAGIVSRAKQSGGRHAMDMPIDDRDLPKRDRQKLRKKDTE